MTEPPVSRGFRGRARPDLGARVPPGQHLTRDFPVLSAGPTPEAKLEAGASGSITAVTLLAQWTWDEFNTLPQTDLKMDIHASPPGRSSARNWRGVHGRRPARKPPVSAEPPQAISPWLIATATTPPTCPLDDLVDGKAHGRDAVRGRAARARAWRAGAAARAAPVLLEEREVGAHVRIHSGSDEPGFWEQLGYHMYGDPVARAALCRRLRPPRAKALQWQTADRPPG